MLNTARRIHYTQLNGIETSLDIIDNAYTEMLSNLGDFTAISKDDRAFLRDELNIDESLLDGVCTIQDLLAQQPEILLLAPSTDQLDRWFVPYIAPVLA